MRKYIHRITHVEHTHTHTHMPHYSLDYKLRICHIKANTSAIQMWLLSFLDLA